MTQEIADVQLLAYLDGELGSDAEYTSIETALHSNEKLRARLQALVDSAESIRRAYEHKLREPVPARLIESTLRAPLGRTRQAQPAHRPIVGVEPKSWGQRVRALWQPGPTVWGGFVAASVAWLALGLMLLPSLPGHAPSSVANQWAQTATVLESERVLVALQALPSGQVLELGGATLEVLGSFAAPDGQHCRELQETRRVDQGKQTQMALACSAGDGLWTVVAAASSTMDSVAYQTASDAMHEAMDAALRQHQLGSMLTPEEENARIAAGWRKAGPAL